MAHYYYVDNFADMIIFLMREYPRKTTIENLLIDLFGSYYRQKRIHDKLQAPIEALRKVRKEKGKIDDGSIREIAREYGIQSSSVRLLAKMVKKGIFRRGFD